MNQKNNQFESDLITLDPAVWTEITPGPLRLNPETTQVGIHGDVSVSDLTDFKITWAFQNGGTHTDFISNAGIATSNPLVLFATANPNTTAAGSSFKILLDKLAAAEELRFYAKGNGTKIQLKGSFGQSNATR